MAVFLDVFLVPGQHGAQYIRRAKEPVPHRPVQECAAPFDVTLAAHDEQGTLHGDVFFPIRLQSVEVAGVGWIVQNRPIIPQRPVRLTLRFRQIRFRFGLVCRREAEDMPVLDRAELPDAPLEFFKVLKSRQGTGDNVLADLVHLRHAREGDRADKQSERKA